MKHRDEYIQKNIIVFKFRHFHLCYSRLTSLSLFIEKEEREGEKERNDHRRRFHYHYSMFILFI